MNSARHLVARFSSARLLVLGDAMLDIHLHGSATRVAPESSAPVIRGERQAMLPGGAANTAAHARALGAETVLLAVIGADAAARNLSQVLKACGVSTDHLVVDSSRPTTRKTWLMAGCQLLARYDVEDDTDLRRTVESRVIQELRALFPLVDAVVVSDYLKGVVTWQVAEELGRLALLHNKPVVVDSKDLLRRPFRQLAAITPNQHEALKLCGRQNGHRVSSQIVAAGWELLDRIDTKMAIITCGADGAILFQRDHQPVRFHGQPVDGPAVGAGDAFAAALALAIGVGAESLLATEVASLVAGHAAARGRATIVQQGELLAVLRQQEHQYLTLHDGQVSTHG